MRSMQPARRGALFGLLAALAILFVPEAGAQTPPPAVPNSAPADPSVPSDAAQPTPVPEDGVEAAAQAVDVPARRTAMIEGQATWEDGYVAIRSAIRRIDAALARANLKSSGRPFAVFVSTDEKGFKFRAMRAVVDPPAGAVDLGDGVAWSLSPSGKALKFEHRGAYDDIDATYEAITAYLDGKGLEAKDEFMEEYLNDPNGPEDPSLAVDIFIFI